MKLTNKYIMKNLIIFFMLTGFSTSLFAQQMSSYEMYHLNNYMQCPAAAGSKPYTFVSAAYSQNWSGFKGAPNMQSATVHSLVSERMGFGGKINYENTGLSGQFGAEATYAYHVPIGKNGTRLSFGLSAVLSQYSLRKDEFIIADLEDEDKNLFLEEMGMTEAGLDRVIRAAYKLLGLETYFTAGVKEVRAWTIKKGSTAPQAAGVIHTDFERGFIRAEVIAYDDYVKYKGEQPSKEAGKMRVEGKTYVVQDGDVMHFLFNV